jgi:hypothetical protein
MRALKFGLLLALVVCTSWSAPSARAVAVTGQGPTLTSLGPLTFSADGTLFAADNQSAAIYAFDLTGVVANTAPGAKGTDGLDQKLAAMLGTGAQEIAVTDLAVHPQTHNAYVSVMRGQGNGAAPALFRIDGTGKIEMVNLKAVKFSKVELPNAPAATPAAAGDRRGARSQTVTDMAFIDGRLWVAGLSNEEFASKLRGIPYPFNAVDKGTSVEIWHDNHAQVETRSPVYAFIPYTINNQPYLIAGYLCTPLVKFPLSSLKPGEKVRGTTIADVGAGNRPLDMIQYRKDGHEYLLMSNNSRGVMKIEAEKIPSAPAITTPTTSDHVGVPYTTVANMRGIEQLDLLDAQNSIVVARADSGAMNLQVVPLP